MLYSMQEHHRRKSLPEMQQDKLCFTSCSRELRLCLAKRTLLGLFSALPAILPSPTPPVPRSPRRLETQSSEA
jgi:hypothetical protein